MTNAAGAPRAEYESRLTARREALVHADLAARRIAIARLLLFLTAAAIAWFAFTGAISGWLLALPLAAFIALVSYHSRVTERARLAQRAIDFYTHAIERVEDRWAGNGETGERFRDPRHPYADDLDLFGPASLFELLSTARTRAGEATLARWLLAPADREEILARQQAVTELRDRIDLREDLAVLGEDFRTGVHPDELAAWGAAPPVLFPRVAQVLAPVLALITAGLLVALIATETGNPAVRVALIAMLAVEGLFWLPLRARIAQVAGSVEQPGHDLALLSQVLARFEAERFQAPKLAALRAALDVQGRTASQRIVSLRRLIELLDSRDNVVLRVFGPPLLWTTQIAFAVERWRAVSGPSTGRWLAAIGELEALCALAGYAFDRPADPFPKLVEGPVCFEGEALGHPLLPAEACVRNNVSLSAVHPLVVISGSNMSGKSTLLRTAGVNAVLALAGAPVRAERLTLTRLRVGASIRVNDSLQDGKSRFYAEITRLREIVRRCDEGPVLFLLDELLNGTNSHDRGIGAEAVVRGLLRRGAIGFVTTHDLALTAIADALAPAASNQHFEDHLENGVITFDYRIREGVVRKSNALELMRAVGLEV
ncbi:MAG: mutS2 1 [Bryobacterales bacterium]|nr:mutS2 1 [Bryobacterales bacterium]